MSERHWISVIIPAYNRAGLIGETLRSLLNQTVPAKEIIVVDDGSTDSTAEKTLEAFENWKLETGNLKKDGREQFSGNSKSNLQNPTFKILRQRNAGPGAARNRGLAAATGEFIHFFDSDDIASPNKHEVQLRALLETGADIAYGPWVKGRIAPAYRFSGFRFQVSGFSATGPILQARGLPEGDLLKALLTNWSIVPHACLFRRSILEKVGGFPEDIWVGEDQLLFLRCLLAGAKVVHTPGTMVYYRVGSDPGKLTAAGAAQKRHARDWARFLLSAKKEIEEGRSKMEGDPAEARRRGAFVGSFGKKVLVGMEVSHGGTANTEEPQGDAQWPCAGAAFSNPSTSELARASENTPPTRCASAPASSPATGYPPPVTALQALSFDSRLSTLDSSTPPAEWFGFRLRAYEAWRDLEKFFPGEESELKNELQGIWKRNPFSGFSFQFSGFVLRKLGGLKLRVLGYREHASFRCGKYSSFIDFGG